MKLRLATFNLENLGIREKEDSPEARARLPLHLAALREQLKRLDADTLAFQECLDPELLEPLFDGFGYRHLELAPPGSSPLRVGVASRHPLHSAGDVAGGISLATEDPKTGLRLETSGAFSRPVFRVVWEAPEGPVSLYVLHGKSKIPSFTAARPNREAGPWQSFGDVAEGRLLTEVKRLAQAIELRRELDRELASDRHARLAVLGDFNDFLDSEAVRCVRGDARAAHSPSLTDQELYPCELDLPPEQRYTQIYRGEREMLDHILVSETLRRQLVGVEVYNQDLRDADDGGAPGERQYVGSDHAPLLAEFALP